MKKFHYYLEKSQQINTKLGSILSDEWEIGKDLNPVKAERVAEKYGEVIRDGIYDFVEYISKLKKDKDPLSPEALKYVLSFIASLKKKINELETDLKDDSKK